MLQMSFVIGLRLALLVGLGLTFGSGIFTKDPSVIQLIAVKFQLKIIIIYSIIDL